MNPSDYRRPYLTAGRAPQTAPETRPPCIPPSTPTGPTGPSTAVINGQPMPLVPVPVAVPTRAAGPNPLSALDTPPQGVTVHRLDLAAAASTRPIPGAPSGVTP